MGNISRRGRPFPHGGSFMSAAKNSAPHHGIPLDASIEKMPIGGLDSARTTTNRVLARGLRCASDRRRECSVHRQDPSHQGP